jgi:hypothetical protein
VPEDVIGPRPNDSTMLAPGNSGCGVVASADAIVDLMNGF